MRLHNLMVVFTAATAFSTALPAGPVVALDPSAPIGLVYTDRGTFNGSPARGYATMDSGLTVIANDPTASYYWATQFFFHNGNGGYFGLQSNGSANRENTVTYPKSAIVSIFRATGAYGPNCFQPYSEGGVPSWSCRLPLQWVEGREYTMRISEACCADLPHEEEFWRVSVIDTVTGAESPIGVFSVPGSWGWLRNEWARFTEAFAPIPQNCQSLKYTKVRWRSPVADGGYHGSAPPSWAVNGPCLDVSRGWDVGLESYHETGIAKSPTDTVGLTIAYYYRSGPTREPDPGGYAHYNAIVGPTTGDHCVGSLRHTAYTLLTSPEFKSRWNVRNGVGNDAEINVWIDRLYLAALYRQPDPAGRSAYLAYYKQNGWDASVATMLNGPEWGRRGAATCTYRYTSDPA